MQRAVDTLLRAIEGGGGGVSAFEESEVTGVKTQKNVAPRIVTACGRTATRTTRRGDVPGVICRSKDRRPRRQSSSSGRARRTRI